MARLPGTLLCIAVAVAAWLPGLAETDMLGRAWLEPMVLAILLGILVGNVVSLPGSMVPGIRYSAKTLLDIAVALLGATLSSAAIAALGVRTFLLIALVVLLGLILSYLVGRALKLSRRLSLLIASGNAICGNSAIAAVAPIIGARREEVAASIALTALIGVVAVLALPFAVFAGGLGTKGYAVLAGLTVYAVPQVVAATAAFGTSVLGLATLVKLVRVVMLGPLTLLLSFVAPRFAEPGEEQPKARARLYLPWFIIAFALLAAVRSIGFISEETGAQLGLVSKQLATVAMAALGLEVRLTTLREIGPPVAVASAASALIMLALAAASLVLL